jgi:hypothetical protein
VTVGALDDLLARGRRRDTYRFAVGDSVVEMEFEALDPVVYERLTAEHLGPDGLTVREEFLPILAAACAVDDGDEDKWRAFLASAATAGEVNSLHQFLLVLNYGTPAVGAGKG